jgi:hypothetical protein
MEKKGLIVSIANESLPMDALDICGRLETT